MKKTIQFITLTCAISWAVAGVAVLLGLRAASGLAYTIFAAAYMLLPAVCVIILQRVHQEKLFRNLSLTLRFNRWFLIAGIVPIIYTFITLGINLLFPTVSFSVTYEGLLAMLPVEQAELAAQELSQFPPLVFLILGLVQAVIAGYTINAFFALGEESGWRGYLFKALRKQKFLLVTLVTGVVWGLWHFPLILLGHNYPEHPVAGVGMMIVWCILLSPVMAYLVIKSKSVIAAAIFHGTLNAVAGMTKLYLVGGNDLINGVTGMAGLGSLLLINIAFFLYDKYLTKENIFSKVVGGD